MLNVNIEETNKKLSGKSPEEIVQWAISIAKKPVVTTNFRPYEGAILNLVSTVKEDVDVVWCDTGYNTPNTYKHAEELIHQLKLNIHLYVPKQTTAHRDMVLGLPSIDDPKHVIFTEQVKLEPFKSESNHACPMRRDGFGWYRGNGQRMSHQGLRVLPSRRRGSGLRCR